MSETDTYNILMYSHDTYGLGHIRRTMAIAGHLRAPHVNILILTGSPIVGRFDFPEQVDFVRIPGMIKKTNEEYLPLSIKIHPAHAMDIRESIITATAKTFRPHLFIADKEPLGLKKEILPALQWIRENLPQTQTVLGLRDIMDDAESIRTAWRKKGVYEALETLYTEIWVYGVREVYDPIAEYDIPDSVSRKMVFTGYIPRKAPSMEEVLRERKRLCVQKDNRLIAVTTGGGGDGYPVMDAYLSMLESMPRPLPFRSILVTGPFMPEAERENIFQRAKNLGVRFFHFYRRMEKVFAAADVVISMGGYNTLCEILSQKTLALLVPRETPRREQLIRAQRFSRLNLADYLSWSDLTPANLREKLEWLLAHPEPFREAVSRFSMTGLDVMRDRLRHFQERTSCRQPRPLFWG